MIDNPYKSPAITETANPDENLGDVISRAAFRVASVLAGGLCVFGICWIVRTSPPLTLANKMCFWAMCFGSVLFFKGLWYSFQKTG